MGHHTVHIVQRLAPGGIESLVLGLLDAGGGDVSAISLEGSFDRLSADWPRLARYAGLASGLGKSPGLSPALVFRLARELKHRRATAVVSHHIGPFLYGGLAARLTGMRHLVHVEHDAWHYQAPKRRLLGQALTRLLQPTLAAVSRPTTEAIREHLRRTPVEVRNGVDLSVFRPADSSELRNQLALPKSAKLVGSVGRLEEVKGHDILIEAARQLGEEVHVVLAGSGSRMSALQAMSAKLGLSDRVHFLGHRDDAAAVLQSLDVFCLPSRNEGLSLTLLEAQACGVSCVATDVGASGEGLCPHSGNLVPSEDPEALAQAIQRVLGASPATSPRAFIEQNFNWSDTVRRYAELTGART